MKHSHQSFLVGLYQTAFKSCLPEKCMPSYLKKIDSRNRVCIIGAGKAAADMAAVAYDTFGDNCYGAVVTRYGYESDKPTGSIEVLTAGHPVPDENSHIAGKRLLDLVAETPADVPILYLISGGGSALMSVPAEGISFEDKMQVHKFLLKSGASINEMNVVRKQLSQVKGGGLAAQAKSTQTSLIISDVVGDDMSIIASGPTIQDDTTAAQALAILQNYQFSQNPSILDYLANKADKLNELSSSKVASLPNAEHHIIANAKVAIDAAVEQAQLAGYATKIIDYEIQGEAAQVGFAHAKIALEMRAQGKKIMLFSGGELTVTVGDSYGDGGPNQEYLLALAIGLEGANNIAAIACDTDGVDGSKDVAGGFIDDTILAKAKLLNLNPADYLANHDSYHFFEKTNSLIIPGPTRTNVNDFRVIVID